MSPEVVYSLREDRGVAARLLMIVDFSRLDRTRLGVEVGKYEMLVRNIESGDRATIELSLIERIAARCAGEGYLHNWTAEQLLDYIINGEDRPFGASPNPIPSGGGEPIDLSEKRTSRKKAVRAPYPSPKTRVAA